MNYHRLWRTNLRELTLHFALFEKRISTAMVGMMAVKKWKKI